MELDQASPVESVVCGDELNSVGRVEIGAVAAVVAALLDVLTGFVEVVLDLFGSADDFGRGLPVRSDVALRVDALIVAGVGEFCDVGEDGDAAACEAHEAVDLMDVRVLLRFQLEVVAMEEWQVPATAEAPEYVQVSKPAVEKVVDLSIPVHWTTLAACDHHLASDIEVLLPGYFDLITVRCGGDDLQRGKHDCCGKITIRYLIGRLTERSNECWKHILHPAGDSLDGLRMFEESGSVFRRVCK